ncbi:MAG: thiamine pyrophosphate-dependent enzyme [Methanomicrobiales archaeon]|nr:thiamine pyrophosphate-dependent enzyme [Methanomicrobiales archaeon]
MARWMCTVCGYIYDEEKGEPSTGTPSNTPFSDLPDKWTCPVCGAEKSAFRKLDEKDVHEGAETTVSDVIVSEMAAWGIQFAFGIPGSSSLGLVNAIRKSGAIKYIAVRHEESAALAASAYNKLTGGLAVCVTIAGPGATNLSTGLYDAKEDHAAVLSLNGQVAFQYIGPGRVQEIDQDAFFRPIAVFNNTIYDKKMAILLLTRALKSAILRHGVAQLSVPNNIQKEPLEARYCRKETCIPDTDILPDRQLIQKAVSAIEQAERPVILAGWGAYGEGEQVLELAKRTGAPILTTFRAKGILPEAHEWVIGILGNVGSPQARVLANESDLLITLGVGFSRYTEVPSETPLVQVDIDPMKLGQNPGTIPLWGNCRKVLPELLSSLNQRETTTIEEKIRTMKKDWDAMRDREADADAVPLRPPYIMKVLSEAIPEEAVISVDVGENQWWFGRNFRIKRQKFAMSGYLGTMAFGLPGAIAGKLAYPDKEVFCITGDGGFSMVMAEFLTAVKYNLAVKVIIMNNHQLGMIQVEQMMENYPNFGTDLLNPDFSQYAENCGGAGISVQEPGTLKAALEKARILNTPVIVDIDTDPKRF